MYSFLFATYLYVLFYSLVQLRCIYWILTYHFGISIFALLEGVTMKLLVIEIRLRLYRYQVTDTLRNLADPKILPTSEEHGNFFKNKICCYVQIYFQCARVEINEYQNFKPYFFVDLCMFATTAS